MSRPADRQQRFALGVCYYPEQWPRDRWETYAQRMRSVGLTYVRIAEFAWSRIEPSEGQFSWSWLDEAIETLAAAGLRIVLCTPTAAPPAWLSRASPEILSVDVAGQRRDHGGRRHYDFSSRIYREHSRRITRAIATRYGMHPAVVGWQTDNELSEHQSYSASALLAFREWLGEQYSDVAKLNEAWGTVFWSQEYGSFDEITLPNFVVEAANPSHQLDFIRFSSDQLVRFQEEQVAILRQCSPGRWVTHNFMRLQPDFDHYRAASCLDFVSWDNYPTGGVEYSDLTLAEQRRWARTGHPDLISVNHDLYRGLLGGRSFWVMEQQCGQINWGRTNPLPAAGAVALWTAQAWGHGANVVSYFRWRAATMAQELMHSGLLRHDESLDRGGEEVAALDLNYLPNAPLSTPVVLLHDYESLWAFDLQPHNQAASYWQQFLLFYTALRSLGVDVDIRQPDSDLSAYRLIVAPALQIMPESRASHLATYAGHAEIVFGPRTAYRTRSGRVHEDGQPGPLRDLVGCSLLNFDGIPEGMSVYAGEHVTTIWAESYRPTTGAATHLYRDGPLSGAAAVVRQGNVTSIGAWSTTLITELLEAAFERLGIPTQRLPEGVRVTRRGRYELWMNFSEHDVAELGDVRLDPVSYLIRER
ncbi:MAG TPA: beta-galactosidase [Nitrolancea sp.]|nr:beta-galactosidase [Nitrolancea sp.]